MLRTAVIFVTNDRESQEFWARVGLSQMKRLREEPLHVVVAQLIRTTPGLSRDDIKELAKRYNKSPGSVNATLSSGKCVGRAGAVTRR